MPAALPTLTPCALSLCAGSFGFGFFNATVPSLLARKGIDRRGLYLDMQISNRNKLQVAFDWIKTAIFGRDTSRY